MSAERDVEDLEDIPNVGPSVASSLRTAGITAPADLVGVDPYHLYDHLNVVTGLRHDPCLLDTFISAVRFMEGAPPVPWWTYTPERKQALAARD